MKKLLPLAGALALASLFTGCASDNLSARIQEKSAAYAALPTWQKKRIEKHDVVRGFTPDMVYMAIGSPTAKQLDGQAEVWVYRNFYPETDASHFTYALASERSIGDQNMAGGMLMMRDQNSRSNGSASGTKPVTSRDPQSIAATGGPQGGSMEPADLVAYQLYITFEHGVVTKVQLSPT